MSAGTVAGVMSDAPILVSVAAVPADAVLCDVRWYLDGRSGHAAFGAGHIPGALFVDLDRVLSAPPEPHQGRHPLPSPEAFAAELGATGIGDADHVVAYDDLGGAIAARLVWMLRVIGRPASLLDGGLAAWTGELETGPPRPRPRAFRTPVPWPLDRLAGPDEVAAHDGELLDARPPARFRGEEAGLDPRAGHIPGARNAPTAANLRSDGSFKDEAELRTQFAGVRDPIVSCGSGVTACHTLLALELAGVQGRLYPGSWSQWSADPLRPVETGD